MELIITAPLLAAVLTMGAIGVVSYLLWLWVSALYDENAPLTETDDEMIKLTGLSAGHQAMHQALSNLYAAEKEQHEEYLKEQREAVAKQQPFFSLEGYAALKARRDEKIKEFYYQVSHSDWSEEWDIRHSCIAEIVWLERAMQLLRNPDEDNDEDVMPITKEDYE